MAIRITAARAALLFLAAVVLAGVAAPWLAPQDPNALVDPAGGALRPPGTVLHAVRVGERWLLVDEAKRVAGGLEVTSRGRRELLPEATVANLDAGGVRDRRVFLLGSDKFGRDVLSRLLHGTRVSLEIAFLALALALALGIPIGALAALGGRFVDGLLMRAVDGLLAFPSMFLLIALAAVFPGGRWSVILLLGGTGWMGIARLVRAEILGLRERDFVRAVEAMGAGPVWTFFRHLLPNALTPILVAATLQVGILILSEVSISYLGFGVAVPDASWGNLIADGQGTILSAWWIAGFPGLAIVATVIAVNVAGDGLRDLLDPRSGRRG